MNRILGFFSGIPSSVWFWLTLLILIFILKIPAYLDSPPVSWHYWRQSDGISIGINYYNQGMHFFQPAIHNQLADQGMSGKAVGELPIVYYLNGALYHLFGIHPMVYRLLNLLLFVFGLWFLFRLAAHVLRDTFSALLLTFWFFTTPVILFYSFSTLPDTMAVASSFAGLYFFSRFSESRYGWFFILSLLCFSLASLFKITAATGLIIICFIWLTDFTGWISWKKDHHLFKHHLLTLPAILLCFALIAAWYLFAIRYNNIHQNNYFSTRIWPIWSLTFTEIKETLSFFRKQILPVSIRFYSLLFIALVPVLVLIFRKSIHKLWGGFLILTWAGFATFSILWFYAFKEHDYYLIYWYILLVYSFLVLMLLIRDRWPKFYYHPGFKILLALIVLFNIAQGEMQTRKRMTVNHYGTEYRAWYGAEPWLLSLGIERNQKVISLPDETPNYTLSIINREGWTQFYNKNLDSASVSESIKLGARWLLITEDAFRERDYLKPFILERIGQRENMLVFSLAMP